MASRREKAPVRKMRRLALVICEGETEANYINIIRKWYKSPVKIISHVEGAKITQALVDKRTKELKISLQDKVSTFLMYDMDVPATTTKVMACNAELLLSNPCFELWLLLHAKNQMSAISTQAVLAELKRSSSVWKNYAKASYTDTQKSFLKAHLDEAIVRAKALKEFQNPSSEVYKILEFLEESL